MELNELDRVQTQAVITAERFVLRPLRRSDAGLIAMYTGDKRVAEGRSEDVWAIDGSDHGLAEVLGVVSLTRIEAGQSELGFWVGSGFWNAGFASEAVTALLSANPHQCKTVFAEVFQDNAGSARVLTNCGFAYLGDAESYSVARGARVATWTNLRKMS